MMRTVVNAVNPGIRPLELLFQFRVNESQFTLGEKPPCDARLIGDYAGEETVLVERSDRGPGASNQPELLRSAEKIYLFVDRPIPVQEGTNPSAHHLRAMLL
jgi:hypothetical protein